MKKIQINKLGKNKRVIYALVDDEDFECLNQFDWSLSQTKSNSYATRHENINNKIIVISMHRTIMNTPKGYEVDHIDHNGLNNQKSNLRNCTRSENCKNRTPRGSSKYLGVCKVRGVYYTVQCRLGNGKKYIGCSKDEITAAKMYDEAAKKYHGEFANLNFK